MPRHPLPSVTESLLPGTLTGLRIFDASLTGSPGEALEDLERQIHEWVRDTGGLIVGTGPVHPVGDRLVLCVVYVPAGEEHYDGGPPIPEPEAAAG